MFALPLFITMVVWLLVVGAIALFIGWLVVTFICGSILYSRLAFSMLAAIVVQNNDVHIIQGGGFANYLVWVAIILAGLYAVSLFPRIGGAIKGLCTMVTSFVAIDAVVLLAGGILSFFFKNDFEITTFFEILIKLICAFYAFGAAISQEGELAINLQNPILANIERLVSSLIHGITILFLFMPMNNNWELSNFAHILVFVLGIAVSFGFSIFAEKSNLFKEE